MSNVIPLKKDDVVPEFIDLKTIDKMTEDQVERLIDGIRLRRTNLAVLVAEAAASSRRLSPSAIGPKVLKLHAKMQKALDRINDLADSIEEDNNKVRALRLQAGDL